MIDLGKPSQNKGFQEYLIKTFCTDRQTEALTARDIGKFIQETPMKEGPQLQKLRNLQKPATLLPENRFAVNFIYSLAEIFQF